MRPRLIDDLTATTLVVIDFEYTTPPGVKPEPIEVAVQHLHMRDRSLQRGLGWEALIRPPANAPVTSFDTAQTGITNGMLHDQPCAGQVLAELDQHFTTGRYLLVAHNAPAEARILYDYRANCPNLARIDLLDTVRLAKHLYPQLPRHTLDELLAHLNIPAPRERHRAMPDVHATTELFIQLIAHEMCSDLRHLRAVAGYPAKAAQPEQGALFP